MNAKRPELSKSEAIRQAIAKLENDYPQFKGKDYVPPAEGEERERHEEYTALKDKQRRLFEPALVPETSISIKVERGEECQKVIDELRFLKTYILKSRTKWTFPALQQRFPLLRVPQILSGPGFDDEDRDTVCQPRVWVYPVRYGRAILAKYYKRKDETIRSYLKSFRSRYKKSIRLRYELTPPPEKLS
jgi:hypothetical protein